MSHKEPLTDEIRLQIFGSPDHYRNPVGSFECRGLRLLNWKYVGNFGDSRDNVFDMDGDSRENLLEILAVVIIVSPISSVRGTLEHTSEHIFLFSFSPYCWGGIPHEHQADTH